MSNIDAPEQPLARRYYQSILYLAERMAEADGNVAPKQRRMITILAEAADMVNFRDDKTYRTLTDLKACSMLDIEEAKAAALVVISLVMKSDLAKRDEELAYFHKIREKLDSDPISVPADLQAHKELALKFLG